MQSFLKAHAQAWRENRHTGARASTRAVVQDARLTLERVSDEVCLHPLMFEVRIDVGVQLMALTARTGMQTFLFAVKSKPEHTMNGFVATSDKAARYLLHGLQKHSSDIVKDFESYVLGDLEGK